ncbi:MAG: hypothetical protein WAK42_22175, partial [Mycobacterium sp.]
TQPCQLSGVTGDGVVTHRAKQLAVEFVRSRADLSQESVPLGIDSVESMDRQQVGRRSEHALVATD